MICCLLAQTLKENFAASVFMEECLKIGSFKKKRQGKHLINRRTNLRSKMFYSSIKLTCQ